MKAFATWSTGRGNGEEDKSKEALEDKKNGFVTIETFRGPLKQSKDFYIAKENSRGLDEISRNYKGGLLVIAGNKDDVVSPEVSKELINKCRHFRQDFKNLPRRRPYIQCMVRRYFLGKRNYKNNQ